MTVNAVPQARASLPEYLAARARRASDGRLAADAIGGLLLVMTFGTWRIPGWYVLMAIGACFLGYGAWAIGNRELLEHVAAPRVRRLALRAVSVSGATIGVAAGIFLLTVILARLLGRIIS